MRTRRALARRIPACEAHPNGREAAAQIDTSRAQLQAASRARSGLCSWEDSSCASLYGSPLISSEGSACSHTLGRPLGLRSCCGYSSSRKGLGVWGRGCSEGRQAPHERGLRDALSAAAPNPQLDVELCPHRSRRIPLALRPSPVLPTALPPRPQAMIPRASSSRLTFARRRPWIARPSVTQEPMAMTTPDGHDVNGSRAR